MTRDGLPAPHERLARMRKSFKRNKTVLTEDYEYFTTPDAPAKPHVSILRNNPRRLSSIPIRHALTNAKMAPANLILSPWAGSGFDIDPAGNQAFRPHIRKTTSSQSIICMFLSLRR